MQKVNPVSIDDLTDVSNLLGIEINELLKQKIDGLNGVCVFEINRGEKFFNGVCLYSGDEISYIDCLTDDKDTYRILLEKLPVKKVFVVETRESLIKALLESGFKIKKTVEHEGSDKFLMEKPC